MSLAEQIKTQKKEAEAPKEPKKEWTPPPPWEDPRPDLEDDHHLWQRLLKLCCNLPDDEQGLELCGVLNGLRCGGTRLVRGKSGGFILRPLIDPRLGWENREEYEYIRDKFAKPHAETIKVLLKVLTDDVRLGRI